MKIAESTALIRFPDCDPFNHLNNARYIDYFINAREDHLKEYFDFDIYSYGAKTGKSWVVGKNQIAYFAPANLMEKVIIQSLLLELNKSDVLVEMRMWDENKTKLKAFLWTQFIHCDLLTGKRIDHDDALAGTFAHQESRLTGKITFEQRLQDVKGKTYAEL